MISRQALISHPHDKIVHRPAGKDPHVGDLVGVHSTDPNSAYVQLRGEPKAKAVKIADLEWFEPHE